MYIYSEASRAWALPASATTVASAPAEASRRLRCPQLQPRTGDRGSAPDLVFRNPRFDALRNALYHTERRNFLDRANRCLNFLVIVFGAGVVSKLAERHSVEQTWLEMAVVVLATGQLVFDLGALARGHEFLQRRYYELLAEMDSSGTRDEEKLRNWSAKLLTISGEEPMTMRALDAVAYNKALDATCDDPVQRAQYRQNVSWWRYLLRHFFAFQSATFHD